MRNRGYPHKRQVDQRTWDLIQGKSHEEIRALRDKWCRPDRYLACEKQFGFWLDKTTLNWILADDDLLFE